MDHKSAEPKFKRPIDVIIIGSCLAGLMAGISLKRRGVNVSILEKAESSAREGLAAGLGPPAHVKRFFETKDRLKDIPLGIEQTGFSVVDQDLEVKYKLGILTNLTTWNAAYYRCRANYDGFESSYCPQSPPKGPVGTEGRAKFLTGKRVNKVEDINGQLTPVVEDVDNGNGNPESYDGDLVIAANGANSTIRRQLNPILKREEPGYVIWRGAIPVGQLDHPVRDKIEKKSPMICYIIPGDNNNNNNNNGALDPESRHINFVWYFWPQSVSMTDTMTDAEGHLHRSTIPKGKIRSGTWQPQIELARRLLPAELSALVERIQNPFVSIVSFVNAPRSAYFKKLPKLP